MPRPVYAKPKPKGKTLPIVSPEIGPRVACAACGKKQFDCGQRKSCIYCGVAPIPSYDYPKTSCFYPKQ